VVAALREEPGKDIALFGGGELFRSLLAAGPVLLGGGIPALPPPSQRAKLRLLDQRVYSKTGTIGLEYEILRT
jgi:dihydrofolate reductase